MSKQTKVARICELLPGHNTADFRGNLYRMNEESLTILEEGLEELANPGPSAVMVDPELDLVGGSPSISPNMQGEPVEPTEESLLETHGASVNQ